MTDLKGKRVAILVTDGFEQIELTSPKEALEKAGAKCVIIAPKDGKVQGFKHHDKADRFNVDLTLAKAEPEEFDAVLLPGGVINADALRIDKMAQRFVKEINLAGGPIAVICHGPWLLINAACQKNETQAPATGRQKLKVVTTVAPITSIVENISGEKIDLKGIIPEGIDSHTFEPIPSDAKLLSSADLIIINGREP